MAKIDIKKLEEAFDRLKDDNGMTFDEYLKWREKKYKPLPKLDTISAKAERVHRKGKEK